MKAAEKRKIEQSIIKERVERRNIAKESKDFDDKPKFVTKGYLACIILQV